MINYEGQYKFTLKLAYHVFFNTSPHRCNSEYHNLKKSRKIWTNGKNCW